VDQETVKRQTEAATAKAMAHARQMRLENEMTGRILKAWQQLDVATDEIVRLSALIRQMTDAGDLEPIRDFERDLALEKARARGKAEILAIIMPAPLNTPEAIGQEAGLRFQARQQGQERKTPGLRMVAKTIMDDVEGRPVTT